MVSTRAQTARKDTQLSTPKRNKEKRLKQVTFKHTQTPIKAKIKTLSSIHSQAEIVKILRHEDNLRINQSTVSRIIHGPIRRHGHSPSQPETRGPKYKFSEDQLDNVKKQWETDKDLRWMSWNEIASSNDAIGELMGQHEWKTLARRMKKDKGISKHIAVTKDEVPPHIARKRVEFAKCMLAQRPNPEDWEDVLFTDECHFSWGPQGKLHVIREQGTRYEPDNIHHRERRPEKDEIKRFHVWAAMGYNFISPLIFYDAGNTNGKMSQRCYVDQILEPHVGKWLRDRDFVMEEDNDSGHGTKSGSNIVAQWKKLHNCKWYANSEYSPDLSIIETGWSPPKQETRRYPHYDDETTKQLILEGWDRWTYKSVNRMVHSMPKRLQDCIALNGQMTGY